MKRILHVVKGLGGGGTERLLVSTVRHLDHSRFDCEVAYLLTRKDALVDELRADGVRVHCLGSARGTAWARRLRRLVSERDVDLVHVHSPHAAVGARLTLPRGLPLVYTEHNVWEAYRRATYWGNLLTFGRNDRVLAVSECVRASLTYPAPLRRLPMPPVETLYHGHDPTTLEKPASENGVRAALGIPGGAPVVGSVANFRPQKGHRYLLAAADQVRRAVPDVRLVLVGAGPLEGAIRRQSEELGLADTLVFAGYRDDVADVIRAFDVFALASVHEGLSVALVEAMALGKPVVATEVGGLPELVERADQGLLVRPGDPAALADAVLTLLRDEGLRSRIGDAGRRRAGDFDIRRAVRRIESVYEELLG